MTSSGELIASKIRFCDVTGKDISLCYETFGSPTDPPLLLVMGLNAQMTVWPTDFCSSLAKSGPFYVIRFDNRDVGLSVKMDHLGQPSTFSVALPKSLVCLDCCAKYKGYELHDMAQDAFALMDYLKLQWAHVVGSSMGGMIGQEMALLYPTRVKTLTLFMTSSGGPGLPGPSIKVMLQMIKKPKSLDMKDLMPFHREFVRNVLIPGVTGVAEETIDDLAHRTYGRTLYREGRLRQMYAVQRARPREERLRSLSVPCLVFHGVNDVLIPVDHGRRLAKIIPGCRMRLVDNMGHFLSREVMDTFKDAVTEFTRSES